VKVIQNRKIKRKKRSKQQDMDRMMEMNVTMLQQSEERQQTFLGTLFKQQQEAEKTERENDREFLLKLGEMFSKDKVNNK